MSSKSNIIANVSDNALVVSFLSGETPRVWRADMGQFQTASLEVQDRQGKFSVVLKRNNSDAEEIGTFADKQGATEALQAIVYALHGKGTATKSGGWFKKLLKFVLYVIITLAVLLFGVLPLIGHFAGVKAHHDSANAPHVEMGVPAPADEVIGK